MFAQLHSPSVIINSMKMSHKFQFKACKLVLASCKLGRQLVQINSTAIFCIGGQQNGTWTNQTLIINPGKNESSFRIISHGRFFVLLGQDVVSKKEKVQKWLQQNKCNMPCCLVPTSCIKKLKNKLFSGLLRLS